MVLGARPPCSACKHFHRSCVEDCIFAPYFPDDDDPDRFAAVHRVFRARHVADLLRSLPVERRQDAVNSLVTRAMELPRPWQPANAQELSAALAAARAQAAAAPAPGEMLLHAAAPELRRFQKEEPSPSAAATPSSSTGERPPCGACKRFHRACPAGCVFAPHFPADDSPERFAAVHAVFGAGYVAELLAGLSEHQRGDGVASLATEALARCREPVPVLDVRVEQVTAEVAAKLKELAGYTGQKTGYTGFHPQRAPAGSVNIKQWNAALEVERAETTRQAATAGAPAAAGTSSAVAPPLYLRQMVVQKLAQRIREAEKLARRIAEAEQLAGFVEVAREQGVVTTAAADADAWRRSDEEAAISPPEPAEAAPKEQQTATATVSVPAVDDPCVQKADDRGDDPSPRPLMGQPVDGKQASGEHAWSSSGATVAPAPEYTDQQLAQWMAWAWLLAVVEEVGREQDTTTTQAAADAGAVPGSSSAVTAATVPPESAVAAPPLIQQPPPSQAQTAVEPVGVYDPDLPKAEDQGGDSSEGSS